MITIDCSMFASVLFYIAAVITIWPENECFHVGCFWSG